jgi:hypothetical protein
LGTIQRRMEATLGIKKHLDHKFNKFTLPTKNGP